MNILQCSEEEIIKIIDNASNEQRLFLKNNLMKCKENKNLKNHPVIDVWLELLEKHNK